MRPPRLAADMHLAVLGALGHVASPLPEPAFAEKSDAFLRLPLPVRFELWVVAVHPYTVREKGLKGSPAARGNGGAGD